ncbi:MAG: sensor histidine kinase [Cytophagaceae bacterium]
MEENIKSKILIVDDREDNLFSMTTVLERDGYVFRTASSGKEALKILLKETDFTLILMDVQMPVLNGMETASMIYEREKLRHIPIIFITANDYNEDLLFKGYQAGAVDYIYKPVNPELLRAKVAVFVELYKKNHLLLQQERKLQMINSELEERVKQRTEELERKNKELENINQILTKVNNDLDSFIYTASHDLKAPVSNIEGLLTTLYDSLGEIRHKDDEVKLILDMMEQSVVRFKSTVTDLTEISKIQKEILEDVEEIDIVDVLEDVKIIIAESIKKNNASFNMNLECNSKIKFSRKNIKSILYNLVSNAIKYRHPDRAPEVNIRLSENNGYTILSVTDNGLGLNKEDLSKIFIMFKRLHTHVEGSGVGLYIVKKIIENSGGKIEVQSSPDKGSTFTIYFKNQSPEQMNRKLLENTNETVK